MFQGSRQRLGDIIRTRTEIAGINILSELSEGTTTGGSQITILSLIMHTVYCVKLLEHDKQNAVKL